jgi:hypothetical protein
MIEAREGRGIAAGLAHDLRRAVPAGVEIGANLVVFRAADDARLTGNGRREEIAGGVHFACVTHEIPDA